MVYARSIFSIPSVCINNSYCVIIPRSSYSFSPTPSVRFEFSKVFAMFRAWFWCSLLFHEDIFLFAASFLHFCLMLKHSCTNKTFPTNNDLYLPLLNIPVSIVMFEPSHSDNFCWSASIWLKDDTSSELYYEKVDIPSEAGSAIVTTAVIGGSE